MRHTACDSAKGTRGCGPVTALIRLTTVVVCLTGVTACTGDEGAGTARTTTSPSVGAVSSVAPTPSSSPPPGADLETACGGDPFNAKAVRPYYPGGPSYSGPGVHPAVLVHMHYSRDPYVPKLPSEWQSHQAGSTQLVVCEHSDESFRSRKVDTCAYDDGSSAELRSARYVYRVFEAATGRLIRRFTLRGSLPSCPVSVVFGAGSSPYYEYVASADLKAKLRPIVTGPAPRP